MSFSTAEKAAIRNYLGFSELWKDIDPRLENAMNSITTDAETRVRAALTKLAALDTKLDTVAQTQTDALKVGSLELNPEQIDRLQDYGRSLIGQIAVTFFIETPRDYYASGGGRGGAIVLG